MAVKRRETCALPSEVRVPSAAAVESVARGLLVVSAVCFLVAVRMRNREWFIAAVVLLLATVVLVAFGADHSS